MKLYDAEGLYVYPGFIDAHSHIGIAEEKVTPINDASNEGTNPVTPCVRAIDAVNPMDNAFHNALAAKEGLGEWEALRAITMDAARICRVDRWLGSLTVGKDADIAIFDGSPFEIATNLKATIINGEIVWQGK
ncbi:MAG: amidohydrolase family protein [Bacillota bacterium]|nr:amidohydrolase family protein [Bacillota bacterium]